MSALDGIFLTVAVIGLIVAAYAIGRVDQGIADLKREVDETRILKERTDSHA